MKKRLLLFAAVLTTSANFALAAVDDKTVMDGNGNAFQYNPKNDITLIYGGDTIFNNPTPSVTPNANFNQITLNSDEAKYISNCNITYNVALTAISENPGTIAPFTKSIPSNAIAYNVVVNRNKYITYENDEYGPIRFIVDTDCDEYKKYERACERASQISPATIISGADVPANKLDNQEMEINTELWYMVQGIRVKSYVPILDVDGKYTSGESYSNSSYTFNPVGISAEYHDSYTVDGTGKVGYVHGAVDDSKVEEILAESIYQKYLNFDFSDVVVIGSIATNINDNRIAYFKKNTDATGQNIVVGTTCDSYVISDYIIPGTNKGQEIFVSKAFSAESTQYKRNFKGDTYGTIVLPFAVPNTGNVFVKQATLTDYIPSENKLTFTREGSISANTPYMFKVLSSISTSGEDVVINGNVNATVMKTTDVAQSANFNGAQFIGSFEGLNENDVKAVYIVASKGKIGRTSTALKPGRCYLTNSASSSAKMENATIEIIDEDGSIEVVEVEDTVTAIDGVVNGKVVSVQYISVNGQVSNEPFSGINIVKKTFADGSVETSKVTF